MGAKQITTARRALVFGDEVSLNQIQAFANTMTKAQLDANIVNSDPTTAQHFDSLISNLGSLGWMITKLGDYSYKPGPEVIRPIRIFADAMITYVKNFLPFIPDSVMDPSNYLPQVVEALRQPPPELEEALAKWWDAARYSVSAHAFLSGPLSSMFDEPFVMLNYFSLKFEATSWHALLDEYPSAAIECRCTSFTMLLNMITYDHVKSAIEAEIAEAAKENTRTVQLDF